MIPGHGQPITPHPNFQLFLTERVMEGAIANTKVSSLYTKCHFVRLNDDFDSIQRMEEVINVHFPKAEFQMATQIRFLIGYQQSLDLIDALAPPRE